MSATASAHKVTVTDAGPSRKKLQITIPADEVSGKLKDSLDTLAVEAARVCDTTLIVSDTNRPAFAEAFREAGREDRLVTMANRTDAFKWLHAQLAEHLREHARHDEPVLQRVARA